MRPKNEKNSVFRGCQPRGVFLFFSLNVVFEPMSGCEAHGEISVLLAEWQLGAGSPGTILNACSRREEVFLGWIKGCTERS
jgi:hypothetical protein